MIALTLATSLLLFRPPADAASAQAARAEQVKDTILSTMLVGNANAGIGDERRDPGLCTRVFGTTGG